MTLRINPAFVLVLSLPLAACASTSDSTHALQRNPSITISSQDLRERVRSLARPLAGIIERSADLIMENTEDPEVRRQALIVKTEAIPAIFEALFLKDPGAALIDASAFTEQFRQDNLDNEDVNLSDRQREIIREATSEMVERLQAVYLQAGASQAEIDDFWLEIQSWARRHPIDSNYLVRDSTSNLVASWGTASNQSLGAAISSTQAVLADFAARADIYAEHLPRQSRWQAQILIEDLMDDQIITKAIDQAGPFSVSIADLPIDFQDQLQPLFDDLRREGYLVGDWIHNERDLAFDFVTDERRAVLSHLTAERRAILEAVTAERIAVLETAVSEREILIEALRTEREATLADLESIVSSALVKARESVIDYVFFRTIQLGALAFPFLLGGGVVLIWFSRKLGRS